MSFDAKIQSIGRWHQEYSSGYLGWRCAKCATWVYNSNHPKCQCDKKAELTEKNVDVSCCLNYVCDKMRIKRISTFDFCEDSESLAKLKEQEEELFAILSRMDECILNAVAYNAHEKRSRQLADWWENYKKQRNLAKAEYEQKEKNNIKANLILQTKLTDDEQQVLKDYFYELYTRRN